LLKIVESIRAFLINNGGNYPICLLRRLQPSKRRLRRGINYSPALDCLESRPENSADEKETEKNMKRYLVACALPYIYLVSSGSSREHFRNPSLRGRNKFKTIS